MVPKKHTKFYWSEEVLAPESITYPIVAPYGQTAAIEVLACTWWRYASLNMLKAHWIIIIREGYRLWIPVFDCQWIDFGHSIQSSAFGEVETCTREREMSRVMSALH